MLVNFILLGIQSIFLSYLKHANMELNELSEIALETQLFLQLPKRWLSSEWKWNYALQTFLKWGNSALGKSQTIKQKLFFSFVHIVYK